MGPTPNAAICDVPTVSTPWDSVALDEALDRLGSRDEELALGIEFDGVDLSPDVLPLRRLDDGPLVVDEDEEIEREDPKQVDGVRIRILFTPPDAELDRAGEGLRVTGCGARLRIRRHERRAAGLREPVQLLALEAPTEHHIQGRAQHEHEHEQHGDERRDEAKPYAANDRRPLPARQQERAGRAQRVTDGKRVPTTRRGGRGRDLAGSEARERHRERERSRILIAPVGDRPARSDRGGRGGRHERERGVGTGDEERRRGEGGRRCRRADGDEGEGGRAEREKELAAVVTDDQRAV